MHIAKNRKKNAQKKNQKDKQMTKLIQISKNQ